MKITAYIHNHDSYIKGKGWTTTLYSAFIYDENERAVNYMESTSKKSLINDIYDMYKVECIHEK